MIFIQGLFLIYFTFDYLYDMFSSYSGVLVYHLLMSNFNLWESLLQDL